MCANRTHTFAERPETLAQRYRLDITTRQKMPVVIQRTRKSQTIEPALSHLEIEDTNHKRRLSPMSRIKSSISDCSESSSFEDEDDVFEGPLTPVSLRADKQRGAPLVVELYGKACKKYDILPMSCIKKGLLQESLECKFIRVQPIDLKCICYALCCNPYVEKMEFQENGLGPTVMTYMGEVIINSSFLTHIKIADNEIKSEGAKVICEAVSQNKMIESLDLSGNGFEEKDGEHFQKLLESSRSLKELYIGHNKLMDLGVRNISGALKQNATLEVIDLSWNHIRLGGAVAIGEALQKNRSLEKVNLSWNGLHQEGAESLALALQKNDTLSELDITSNRLTEYCIASVLKGLATNTTLRILRIGQNQITTRGALSILQNIKENKRSGIRLLDLGSQEVHDKFETLYKEMQKEREITVVYGMTWSTDRLPLAQSTADEDELALLSCNPLTVLMESMRLQNMRLIDFFKTLDVNNSNNICIDELCEGMLKFGIPLRRQTLLKLLRKLDKDNNNHLDYSEMVEAQNLHRQKLRKMFANEKVEFEKTEIGKVSIILRRIMLKSFVMKTSDSDTRAQDLKTRPTSSSPFQLEIVQTAMGNLK